MADYEKLKSDIASVIKNNGAGEITGAALQEQMLHIVDTLNEGKAEASKLTELESEVKDSVANIKPIIINGNVTNAPDEEDITSEDNLLKLKDRSALNGMGYVVLRKNKSFASQVSKPNTIYEIRYDFDLGGATHNMPSNATLKFVGGCLSNGKLIGSETRIEAGLSCIFSNDMTILGEWSINEAYPEWYGALGDGVTDDADALNKSFQTWGDLGIAISATGKYAFSSIRVANNIELRGRGKDAQWKHIGMGVAFLVKPINLVEPNFIRVRLQDIHISLNEGTRVGIEISECIGSIFDNIRIMGVSEVSDDVADYPTNTIGFFINGESDAVTKKNSVWNNDFSHCAAYNVNTGLKIDGIISDCHFNVQNSSNTNIGVELTSESSFNVSFTDCTFVTNIVGFLCKGLVRNLSIVGCNVENYKDRGIYFEQRNANTNSVVLMSNGVYTIYEHIADVTLNSCSGSIIASNVVGYTAGLIDGDIQDSLIIYNRTSSGIQVPVSDSILKYNAVYGYGYVNNSDCLRFKTPNVAIDRLLSKLIVLYGNNNNSGELQYDGPCLVRVKDKAGYNTYIPMGINSNTLDELRGNNIYVGTSFYVTTHGCPAWLSTDWATWKCADGAVLGTARHGATASRPLGTNVYVGFQYFDTSLGKPIWYKGSNVWVDAIGATV